MRTEMLVDAIHAEVIDRKMPVKQLQITASLGIQVESFSEEEKTAVFRYKLVKSSPMFQISISGIFTVYAVNEKELELLRKAVEDSSKNNPPMEIVQTIALRINPILLHIEEEMGLPMIPFIPALQSAKNGDDAKKDFGVFQ